MILFLRGHVPLREVSSQVPGMISSGMAGTRLFFRGPIVAIVSISGALGAQSEPSSPKPACSHHFSPIPYKSCPPLTTGGSHIRPQNSIESSSTPSVLFCGLPGDRPGAWVAEPRGDTPTIEQNQSRAGWIIRETQGVVSRTVLVV